jgi:hypothetical protein
MKPIKILSLSLLLITVALLLCSCIKFHFITDPRKLDWGINHYYVPSGEVDEEGNKKYILYSHEVSFINPFNTAKITDATLNFEKDMQKLYPPLPDEKNGFTLIKKVYDLINSVDSLHSKTSFNVKLTDVNFKYFYRIYKSLDRIFQTLEMLVRESEIKQEKTDYDWIILSKYHTFLDVKNIMYSLQKKIHKYIDSKGSCIYALNHGNLSLNHFIGKKFISYRMF